MSATYLAKSYRPGSGTWPVGFPTCGGSLRSTAASASSHGVSALLPCAVTQGLEVECKGALHQEHQRQDEQRDVPGESVGGQFGQTSNARGQDEIGERELQDLSPDSEQVATFREGDDGRNRNGIDQQVGQRS